MGEKDTDKHDDNGRRDEVLKRMLKTPPKPHKKPAQEPVKGDNRRTKSGKDG